MAEKVQEFEPPQACISRIIKTVLPDNIQVSKDARAAFTRAAGIFIFYLTHCANDFSRDSKRQTIYTQDILNALKELDFGEFNRPLEEFLEVYRKETDAKKCVSKEKKTGGEVSEAAKQMGSAPRQQNNDDEDDLGHRYHEDIDEENEEM